MEKFKDIFRFAPKSKIKASEGLDKGRFPFYTSSQIQDKRVDTEQYFDEALIFGTGGRASIHYEFQPFSTSTDCFVTITTRNDVNTKYVYYYLSLVERGFKGAGLKHLSKGYLENIEIPLPDLETQNKIVTILDKAKAIVDKREHTIRKYDELLRAVFLEMFGDPVKNEKGWEKKSLEKIGDIQGGLQVTSKRSVNPIELPYLRVANIYRDRLDLDEVKTIFVTEPEAIRTKLKKGDILFVEGHGNAEEVGRSAVWDESIEICLHQNHLIRFRLSSDYFFPRFINYYLNTSGGRTQMLKVGKTTSGLKTISSQNIKDTTVIIPPKELQKSFEIILQKKEQLQRKAFQSKKEIEELINSLSQLAFNGQLNFNTAVDLEVLLENDYKFFKENSTKNSIQLLLERLDTGEQNSNRFNDQQTYDKAKSFVFELIKEGKVEQIFDVETQKIKLSAE